MNKAIITVVGKDRPGIVSSVAGTLLQLGCNIENVSQTILQGEFAGIYIVSAPNKDRSAEDFCQAFTDAFQGEELQVHAKPMEKDADKAPSSGEHFIITTTGPDNKGLVHDISRIIASFEVNIIHLKAVFKGGDAPEKNIMVYEVLVPDELDRTAFSAKLKSEASRLNLTLTFQHKNIFDTVNRI